jgi:cytochrome P450
MSVCLTDDLYANEPDHIVNEILLFFLAGALTMSLSSANMVIFMNQSRNAHYKKQLLDEIDTVFKPKKDLLNEFTNDDLDDLIFLKQCYNETLRMDTPVGVVTPYKSN